MKKKQEANTVGGNKQLLRTGADKKEGKQPKKSKKFKAKESMHESGFLLEAIGVKKDLEGGVVKCVLITEGLGNRHDMNYYSADAIASAPAKFEGKPCFINHPTESDEQEIPERRVEDQCGYFKNLAVAEVNGRTALVGEIHFDLSESGKMGYAKALTALHYAAEFPDGEQEYVGLSINADGDRVQKTVQVGDEVLDVNYVRSFTGVASCDLVTKPARGGEFVALVESAAGAILNRKENTMLVKDIKAARTALTEAMQDMDAEEKKKLQKANSLLNGILTEAMKAAEDEDETESKKESEDEDGEKKKESEDEDNADSAGKKKKESEDEDEDDGAVQPGHKVTKTTTVKHDGPDDSEDEDADDGAAEANRIAVKSLLKEAAIPKKLWDLDKLVKMPFKEAKAEIKRLSNLLEAVRESDGHRRVEVPVGQGGKLIEADTEGSLDSHFESAQRVGR